jgi:NAD+ synthase (glutamine-hydrolysing)
MTIKKWLRDFYRALLCPAVQALCLPDGPKVGSAALSPRGDWRMPSDAQAAQWQAELDVGSQPSLFSFRLMALLR